jgi:hypothetical protein
MASWHHGIKHPFDHDIDNKVQASSMTLSQKPRSLGLMMHPEAQALWTRMALMNVDVAMTVAMRLPIFAHAAMGDASARKEAKKAIDEKLSAIAETSTIAAQAAVGLWWDVAMSPLTRKSPSESAAKAAHKTMGPISRRVRANRRRLSDIS